MRRRDLIAALGGVSAATAARGMALPGEMHPTRYKDPGGFLLPSAYRQVRIAFVTAWG